MRRSLRALLVASIRSYQRVISPVLPAHCRFYPSCSAYAAEAVGTHGLRRGGWLACCRIGKCHPFHPGGFDPVPPRRSGSDRSALDTI